MRRWTENDKDVWIEVWKCEKCGYEEIPKRTTLDEYQESGIR